MTSQNLSLFKPALLAQEKRNCLVELQYYGLIVYYNSKKGFKSAGTTNSYPFFQRSCAKPLQASLIKDYKTDDYYDLNEQEIAITCGSHTGEKIHTDILKNLLKKGDLKVTDLQCPIIPPLNNVDGIKNVKDFSPLHNNCSGKHTLMLLLCRQNGWSIKNYLDINHPLQKAIHQKIKILCEEENDLPVTLDGCTAPNFATSLEALTKGFLNLAQTHPKITNAMKNHPYLVGGQNRLDTHIMEIAPQTVAKAGAGGLCTIVNTDLNEALTLKIIDADMKVRTIIALEALIQLNWVNKNSINTNLLKEFFDKNVYTENSVKVGEYSSCFDLSSFR